MSKEKLSEGALKLGQQDRAEDASLLINSLDPTSHQEVDEAWLREVERRTAELDAGTVETIPWETVRARMRARRP